MSPMCRNIFRVTGTTIGLIIHLFRVHPCTETIKGLLLRYVAEISCLNHPQLPSNMKAPFLLVFILLLAFHTIAASKSRSTLGPTPRLQHRPKIATLTHLSLQDQSVSRQEILPSFEDRTARSNIAILPKLKFGGPIIADLNSDGFYDLILTFHKEFFEIYFNSRNGTFTRSSYTKLFDLHGVSVAPRTATERDRLVVLSIGGANGNNPKLPFFLNVGTDNVVEPVIRKELEKFSQVALRSRGRISMFMDMSLDSIAKRKARLGGPDVLIAGFLGSDKVPGKFPKQYAFRNRFGNLSVEKVPGFEDEVQGRTELTDVDGDMRMEIVSYQEFRIYQLIAPFKFADVTAKVAPGFRVQDYSVMAVVEFDMDNDGDFDLYLARGFEKLASTSFPIPRDRTAYPDILLENRNGKYYDVTKGSNIVGNTFSSGVSAGDFNNDGFVDLIVTQRHGSDIILMNNGDGTFEHHNPKIPKPIGGQTDNSMAVDIDGDGNVDIISAQGISKDVTGSYKILKNMLPRTRRTNFLIIRVGNTRSRSCTALHAVVTVRIGMQKMVRRVGSGGGQKAGPGSMFDIVHFGIGDATFVDRVGVKWITGESGSRRNVKANQTIKLGAF